MSSNKPPPTGTPRPTDPRTPRTPSNSQLITNTTNAAIPGLISAPTPTPAPGPAASPSPRTPVFGTGTGTPTTPLPFTGSGGLTLDSPFGGADSPPRAETPPPDGIHGDIELELLALANALYNLGTSAINDNTREKPGPDGQRPDKRIGMRVNHVVEHLATIEEMSQRINTMIPIQVLAEIDNGRNPMQLSRERIERAALENQFMNGKLSAIESYTRLLDEALSEAFPELAPFLQPDSGQDEVITTEVKPEFMNGHHEEA